jgi:alpha-tubulin suppressor-like RCC1 family protein
VTPTTTRARAMDAYAAALGALDAARSGRVDARNACALVDAYDDVAVEGVLRACGARDDAATIEALARRRARCDEGASTRAATDGDFAPTLDLATHGVDDDSGWSAMHHACYYGALTCARALTRTCRNARWETPRDARGRGALDVMSEKLTRDRTRKRADGTVDDATRATYVYSFGSGANYCLGTGRTETERKPARVEGALANANATSTSASKYHALAVDARAGRAYAWGCARDGVLGLGRERGDDAVVFPTLVRGFGNDARVVRVSAGLAHSAATTDAFETFTWGNATLGRLGYAVAVEESMGAAEREREGRCAQFTPRKVPNMTNARAVDVSCGDTFTAVLDADGAVWTMGSNARGALGYYVGGGADSSDGPYSTIAKQVEYLKHRDVVVTGVSSAKQHVVACSSAGDAYSWGNGSVSVRRVIVPKAAADGTRWHEVDQRIVKVSAGGAHSAALTADGWVYVWDSASERVEAQLLADGDGPSGRAVDVSCGATSSAIVTDTGDLYTWESNEFDVLDAASKNALSPVSPKSFASSGAGEFATKRRIGPPRRVHGLKGIASVCVGDGHVLALQEISRPKFSLGRLDPPRKKATVESELDRLIRDIGSVVVTPPRPRDEEDVDDAEGEEDDDDDDDDDGRDESECSASREFPSLKVLAQHAVANFIEPRNVLDCVQLADQINAVALKRFAIEYAVKNIDVVLLETPKSSFDSLEEETLEDITRVLRSGDVVGGWTEDAMTTRSVGRESDDEIMRAATLAPRARVTNKAQEEEKVDVGKPPLASHVVAKAAPRTPPSSSSRVTGSLSMFLSGELDKGKSPSAVPTSNVALSLRDIQSQQERAARRSKSLEPSASAAAPPTFSPSPSSPNAFSLGDLLRRTASSSSSKKPAWRPPKSASPTMREIIDAEASAKAAAFATTTGFNVARASSTDRSSWYVDQPRERSKSLREIVDEERQRRAEEAELALALEAIARLEADPRVAADKKSNSRRRRPRARGKGKDVVDASSSPRRARPSPRAASDRRVR